MMKTSSTGEAPISKNLKSEDQFIERCQRNQSVFSSFIDLIPSKIYLNPDDHSNWIRHVTAEPKKKTSKAEVDTTSKQNGSGKVPRSDDDDSEMEVDAEDDGEFNRVNKFDPRVFKTVSQIFKDFQLMEEKEKKFSKIKFPQLKKNNQEKSTSVKVLNKSQHKSLSKNEDGTVTPSKSSSAPANKSAEAKKALKRVSKQKEQKNIAAKRQRQRYDSHTEPQIVSIDHEEANSISDRKQILNRSGQVVFSKFDFTADKTLKKTQKKGDNEKNLRENPKDYKKLIKKLQDKRERIDNLKLTEPEKAMELETTEKWKTAIDKASGVKVKDDINLLKKSLKKVEKKKEKTKRDWNDRVKEAKRIKERAQDKRQKNIEKRREKTKETKIKKLKKKGRIMPGF